MGSKDIEFTLTPSIYSRNFDSVWIGPNVLPESVEALTSGATAIERMTPRAAIAHEAGHRALVHAGRAFSDSSVLDEIAASLMGRTLNGLSNAERWSLLRDAVEKANAAGVPLRQLLPLIKKFGWQGLP